MHSNTTTSILLWVARPVSGSGFSIDMIARGWRGRPWAEERSTLRVEGELRSGEESVEPAHMPIVRGGLRCLILVVLDLLLLPAAGQPAMAQNSVRQLQVEDIAQGSMLAGEAALSPDGAWVAYTVCDRKRV